MLAQFPSRDADEPATKDFVALQVAHLDGRFAQIDGRFAQIDARFAQIDARFAQVDAEFAKVRAEMAEMESRLRQRIDEQADRLMTRMQILMGVGFGFLSVVLVFTR